MGWLCVRKHPDVISKGSKISLADLEADPIVMFQHKHYIPSMLIGCFLVPSVLPYLLWNESLWTGYVVAVLRYVCVLHGTWLVNSLAHIWGDRPYDVNIHPSENKLVSFFAVGEGFHNYHHTFPHDYSASEWRYSLNLTTAFIDAMALVGQAYDRRSMSQETVERRIERTGPGAAAARKSVVKEEMEY